MKTKQCKRLIEELKNANSKYGFAKSAIKIVMHNLCESYKEDLKFLIYNKETRIDVLIKSGVKELNGTLFEMNKRIKTLKESVNAMEKLI